MPEESQMFTEIQQSNPIGLIDKENSIAIAQLQAWMQQEATDDPDEIRKADAEIHELMQNLNRNRIESGERPLFP